LYNYWVKLIKFAYLPPCPGHPPGPPGSRGQEFPKDTGGKGKAGPAEWRGPRPGADTGGDARWEPATFPENRSDG